MVRALAVVLGVAALGGCATTVSTMQPAETLAPGHVQASGGLSVHVPASRVVDAIDVSTDMAARYVRDPSYRPSSGEQRRLLASAIGLGLSSPGANQDLMLRVGVAPRLDAGIRWSGLAAHADAKYMFVGDEDSFQVSLSIGASKALFSGLAFDVLEAARVAHYSRWNVEVPVIMGKRLKTSSGATLGHVWFGPKYIASFYSLGVSLQNVGAIPETSGVMHHVGAFGGVALGYKYVFAFAEMNLAYMFARPEVLGVPVNLGGIVVVPAGGLMLRI